MEHYRKPIRHVIAHDRSRHNLSGLSRLMDAGSDIDSIALQESVFRDHIVDIDADAKMYCEPITAARRTVLSALDVSRPSHRVNCTRKLDQHAIAGEIDQPSIVSKHVRFHDLCPQRLPTAYGLNIIKSHQMGKARDVSEGDSNKSPFEGRRCDRRCFVR
jgi:hypothetical protein